VSCQFIVFLFSADAYRGFAGICGKRAASKVNMCGNLGNNGRWQTQAEMDLESDRMFGVSLTYSSSEMQAEISHGKALDEHSVPFPQGFSCLFLTYVEWHYRLTIRSLPVYSPWTTQNAGNQCRCRF